MTPINFQDVPKRQKEERSVESFQYVNKFRSALLAAVLFVVLSQQLSYKVLDVIFSSVSNNQHIIDEDNNISFIGILIMSCLMALIVFIF